METCFSRGGSGLVYLLEMNSSRGAECHPILAIVLLAVLSRSKPNHGNSNRDGR
jgi:hypothetical protein